MFLDPVQSYNVYWAFKEIDEQAHTSVIRFYEAQKDQIMNLEFDEYFELLIVYANALFETGKYYKHLSVCDRIIESSIECNIHFHRGEDIYYTTLFKKAASYFNVGKIEACLHILRELLKMDPSDKYVKAFYQKCRRCAVPEYVNMFRAAGILLFLGTAFIIALELLLFRPFYPEWYQTAWITRSILFGAGVLSIGASDLYYRWEVYKEFATIQNKKRIQ